MTTKFNVGDEVYIKARVKSIEVKKNGVRYTVIDSQKYTATYNEDELASADVEDFRRETADEIGDGC